MFGNGTAQNIFPSVRLCAVKFSLFIFVFFSFSQRFSRVFSPSNPARTHTPTEAIFSMLFIREAFSLVGENLFVESFHFFRRENERGKSDSGEKMIYRNFFLVTIVDSFWHF
jgi:hypothetical protein